MDSQSEPPGPPYRPTKPLPFELRQHCGIYFEEHLYCQALNLLSSLVSSGTASWASAAYLPPPEFLALTATLVVHPSTTTRAKTDENRQAANIALQLLRLTNALVGPEAADFNAAFVFTHFTKSRSGARRLVDNLEGQDTGKGEALDFELANRGSLWSRAEDFWHIVGWAFNCAVLHPSRWPRWKLLLEFLCEVLEDDWRERVRRSEELGGGGKKKAEREELLCGSLIYTFFKGTSGISSPERRMMRAIFADGTPGATNEFREIFHNELQEAKQDGDKLKKREVNVNIAEDIYGDYLEWDLDDDEGTNSVLNEFKDELPTRPKRKRRTKADGAGGAEVDKNYDLIHKAHSESLTLLGDLEALALRQRFLAILSAVSEGIPNRFMELDHLYLLFVDFIRHLPLPIFQLFVSPSVLLRLPVHPQTTLCEMLLERLRENKKRSSQSPYLNQDKLEADFLPYAASTSSVIDNARVSILLESVLRSLSAEGLLHVRPSLKEAVEEGILARGERAQTDTKKGQSKMKAEEFGWTWLIESGERLMHLVLREEEAPTE
ncbi:predicted protein [Uncinocarpus reesii 1704]|uniref:Uncharacterized protein n=1 Tax=Uncinocarpus reesii (strain UAMH 1704) TaxID=336963 RepID=C4JRR9_UNCRE|nr:uncharacterized protein UREG_05158 [Uncinocarpus reesii 1704]EEP80316.1 predicted protein [Uncinocarpus reesii 1704]